MVDQESELDSMRGSITALQAELGTELLSQLDTRDQRIVSIQLLLIIIIITIIIIINSWRILVVRYNRYKKSSESVCHTEHRY